MKYKPKTQEIEAFRFGYDEMPRWFIDEISKADVIIHGISEAPQYCEINMHNWGAWAIADAGDYVVRYPDGYIAPIQYDRFIQLYEAVE